MKQQATTQRRWSRNRSPAQKGEPMNRVAMVVIDGSPRIARGQFGWHGEEVEPMAGSGSRA